MPQASILRPQTTEYGSSVANYIALVPDGDILATLARQAKETTGLLRALPAGRADYRYAPGKWSVREVLGHVIDSERIFSCRALRIGRGDRTPLPGFDQDVLMQGAGFGSRPMEDLLAEFELVRRSTLMLFGGLSDDAWGRRGKADDVEISVRALAFLTAGHELHHCAVLHSKYGM